MPDGTIKFLNFAKGFGFISRDDEPNEPDVFFHANQRHQDEHDDPCLGIKIYFDVKKGSKGPVATNWRLTPEPEVVIDPEGDRREGYRPGVLIRYRWCDQILLGRRRGELTWLSYAIYKEPDHPNSPDWMFAYGVPQGGIEPGESCEDAIRRELTEELGDFGKLGWGDDITIKFLFKERTPFRFEKDGRSWNGKVLYAFDVVGQIPEPLWDWHDEGFLLPAPEFEGGVQTYELSEAMERIQSTQKGPKGKQLMRLLEAA